VEESKHPYDNNTDEIKLLVIPGAEALEITFHANSVRFCVKAPC
jgi:hypothetical protein